MTQPPDLAPAPALAARFHRDLSRLCDGDSTILLVAVSGGADSLALLLLAHAALGDRCRAATVDHGLRQDSASEAAFVAALCAQRGIAHRILSGEMPARSGRTANVSARARAFRYRLLEDHARDIGASAIATAHHADDQLETLVMRLNRGAGLAGLAGIRPRGGMIVRPLLAWRHAELAAIVADCGVTAIDDPSNVDDRYDRARLRKVLADADWLDVDHVGLSARALGDAEEALAWAVRDLAARMCHFEPGLAVLQTAGMPFEIKRRLVERCVRHVDPASEIRGPALVALIASLDRGERAMLGDVLCEPLADEWRFTPAPPRRSH